MDKDILGVYQLKRLLGRGGMGSVYLAHDPRLSRDVALKVLSPELARQPEFRERFVSEARSCSALNHPNITTIHEIGEADGLHYIAFEFVDGETLERVLEREGRLTPERVLELAVTLAGALGYAHERGILHRDLKPANLVLSHLGIPKILDFGLAKTMGGPVEPETETMLRLTQAGMVVGTIAYMAPEQALGQHVDARSDVFSFGCLLYEMLAGKRPFSGMTAPQLLDRLLHDEPTPLDGIQGDVAGELGRVVAKCLRKDPNERYQSMGELEAALRSELRDHERSKSQATAPIFLKKQRWRAAVGILAATALFFLVPSGVAPPETDAVAVMYFENLSDPADGEQLGRMLTHLLTSELSSFEELHVVSRQRIHDVAAGLQRQGEPIDVDRSVATSVAEAAGVRTMVVGQLVSAGGRMVATTELVDVASGRSLASQRASGSSAEDIFVLADSLGEQVRAQLGEVAHERVWDPTEPTEPTSLEAYRQYVAGELYLHASELDDAVESFSEAVRIDPDFALAHHRLSMTARWLSDGPLAHQAARRASALMERAPAHLREIIEANALYQDGAFAQAIPLLESVLARDAEQKEALYILSQIYVHSLRDGDLDLAIEHMERLLALDPSFHQVYDRLALSYAFRGEPESARERMTEWEPNRPDKVMGLRSILATLEGQPEEALGFGQVFSWIEGPLFQSSAAIMASRWDIARRLVEQNPDEWRSDHLRAWALRNRGVFHAYVGEFERAVDFLRQAGMASGLRTHEGGSAGVPASALHAMAELYYLNGESGAARIEVERALSMQPESFRGLYFAGRMALFDDDVDAATRYLEALVVLPATTSSASARVYHAALSGELALYSGDVDRAVGSFERATSGSLMLDWASTSSSAGAAIRDGLVRSYLASSDTLRAVATMEAILSGGAERLDHPVIYASTLYRLGVLELERGRVEEGRRLLRRFVDLWGGADWKLEIVEDARSRLGS